MLVNINNAEGLVSIECDIENQPSKTVFEWISEDEIDGFRVLEDSIGIYLLDSDDFLPITELASEIFLWSYIQDIIEKHGITDIKYITDGGIEIKQIAFIPPCITKNQEIGDELCKEFPELQNRLKDIWSDFREGFVLNIGHIEVARNEGILEDLISLLNLNYHFLHF